MIKLFTHVLISNRYKQLFGRAKEIRIKSALLVYLEGNFINKHRKYGFLTKLSFDLN